MYSSGLAFEEVDQGLMENIVVNNITMNHVHHYPIYITTGCRNRGPKERTTVSTGRDIMISNVIANDVDSLAGIIVTGMPGQPLRNISLSNIRLQYRGGGKAELAKRNIVNKAPTTQSQSLPRKPQPSVSMPATWMASK